ncbi:MAG TPA: hypothetical protein VMK53_09650 [Gemmatimonadales bacterium]|nr:hypothetical protein [Gemmatimonadales bacterium]
MRSSLRSALVTAGVSALLAGCGGEDTTGPGGLELGTYTATTFSVTPAGEAPINVLGGGGSLVITLHANGTTSGTLSVPASAAGGTAFVESMEGTVTVTSLTVTFQQTADTFVRDLTWSRQGQIIAVTNQVVAGTSYTIVLQRL